MVCNEKQFARTPAFHSTTTAVPCWMIPGYLILFLFVFLQENSRLDDYRCLIHPFADCTFHSSVNRQNWHSVLKQVSTKLLNHVLSLEYLLVMGYIYNCQKCLANYYTSEFSLHWVAGVHMPHEQAEAFVIGSQLWQPLQPPAARGGKRRVNSSEVEVCVGIQLYPGT